jgi:hypothetical protein
MRKQKRQIPLFALVEIVRGRCRRWWRGDPHGFVGAKEIHRYDFESRRPTNVSIVRILIPSSFNGFGFVFPSLFILEEIK